MVASVFGISVLLIDATNGAEPSIEVDELAARPSRDAAGAIRSIHIDGERQFFRNTAPTNPRAGT